MSTASIVETPVEPLVLSDDREASRDVLPAIVVLQESQSKTQGLALESRMEQSVLMADDEEDELGDEVAPTIESVAIEDKLEDPRVATHVLLLVEPLGEKLETTEEHAPQDNPKAEMIQNNEPVSVEEAGAVSSETEAVSDVLVRETPTSSSSSKDSEHEPTAVNPDVISEIQVYLHSQIVENQTSSHAKEIHEFLCSRISEKQLNSVLPRILRQLSREFYEESVAHNQDEVSVDIQSSLCLLEQMFLTMGRRSPLQDMYTAEEEELLDQLATSSSSCTNSLSR